MGCWEAWLQACRGDCSRERDVGGEVVLNCGIKSWAGGFLALM